MVSVTTLKQRADFVKLTNAGARFVAPAFIVQYIPAAAGQGVHIGFTATKKIGGAVQRNRAKRRLRAVFDEVVRLNNTFPAADVNMVLVARAAILERDYTALVADFKRALKQVGLAC